MTNVITSVKLSIKRRKVIVPKRLSCEHMLNKLHSSYIRSPKCMQQEPTLYLPLHFEHSEQVALLNCRPEIELTSSTFQRDVSSNSGTHFNNAIGKALPFLKARSKCDAQVRWTMLN